MQYQKQCQQFGATLTITDIMNGKILNAQKQSEKLAKISYTEVFLPLITKRNEGRNIALHPSGKPLDSFGFSKLFFGKTMINFFIGGSYGFDEEFLGKTMPISLSPLTFSHKIVKVILCEQIYRALSILNHHPYHK